MNRSLRGDRGQTLPLFIVASMALLFLAFALFAVGQAAVHRNSTQSAADAAALAAAQEAREGIKGDLEDAILDGDLDGIADLLDTDSFDSAQACDEAGRFAAKNKADVESCDMVSGPPGYKVAVVSQNPLGKTEVEGTEDKYARTVATAVIEPRCSVREGDPGEEPEPEPSPSESGEQDEEPPPDPVTFDCEGELISIDPADLDLDMAEFFSVHLRD